MPIMSMLHNLLYGQANDGVCDDGRVKKKKAGEVPLTGADFAFVLCDLGTDCTDCGPWAPVVEPVW